jgi:hypothetical protein
MDTAVAPRNELSPLTGEAYLPLLARLHRVLRPTRYLEIGSRTGDSLAVAQCASIAIDPAFNLAPRFFGKKPLCALYQTESDAFFRTVDPEAILGGKIDFAFLDGMHLAEFLLRDFANTERHCRRNSLIALHDCIPLDLIMTRRNAADRSEADGSRYHDWWTGDVWKTVAILRKYRPDLHIHAVDAIPTGLILITNLDPSSTFLTDHHHALAAEMLTLEFPGGSVAGYHEWLCLMPTQELATPDQITRFFWI